jgi:hypothetical protein
MISELFGHCGTVARVFTHMLVQHDRSACEVKYRLQALLPPSRLLQKRTLAPLLADVCYFCWWLVVSVIVSCVV